MRDNKDNWTYNYWRLDLADPALVEIWERITEKVNYLSPLRHYAATEDEKADKALREAQDALRAAEVRKEVTSRAFGPLDTEYLLEVAAQQDAWDAMILSRKNPEPQPNPEDKEAA